jgi:hypothetical protein
LYTQPHLVKYWDNTGTAVEVYHQRPCIDHQIKIKSKYIYSD